MTTESLVDIQRLPVNEDEQSFNDWTIKFTQSHILHSQCSSPSTCVTDEKCQFCIYRDTLDLPHLPDMVFPNNILSLKHESGAKIEFIALDALKVVSNGKLPFKVACAQVWQESRPETNMEEKIKPFDWTFSTDYKGTLTQMEVSDTTERINLEKLKQREKILFYHELTLFEDELHDNGIASCTVKIRVMPSSFFLLLRYFLRVDNVMVKLNDTRIFHEFGNAYILREYTSRESTIAALHLPLHLYTDPNSLAQHVPIKTTKMEKLTWDS